MKLSLREVEHVAELARLALSAEEKERFRAQLSAILEYAGRLQQLDVDAAPTSTVLHLSNVLRDDEARPSMPLDDLLANAPAAREDCLQVPAVLEDRG